MRCLLFIMAFAGTGIADTLGADAPPRPTTGVGQLLVSDPQSGATMRLNLARYHVHAVLNPPVALVQIDQSFYNPYQFQQEGTFVFNLPDGASVSRFAMYTTHTQLIEGELIDRARAANIYQSIVDRQRDPALLEQIGGNLFRMRVFPISPRDTKRILLDYTVPLIDQADGKFAFELPLMSDLEPIGDFSLTGTIHGATVSGSPASSSHPDLVFDAERDAIVRFRFAKASYQPHSSFELTFQQTQGAHPVVRSYTHTPAPACDGRAVLPNAGDGESTCEFLATISPSILDKNGLSQKTDLTPFDVLVVADTSGAQVHQRALRQTVRAITTGLRPQDRFQLGCVDVGFRAVSKNWITPQSAEAVQSLASFDREFFLGTADFGVALQAAIEALPPAEPGRRRCVIYVGDGRLPVGSVTPHDMSTRLAPVAEGAKVQFSAVLFSNDTAGRVLMDRLATTTGGRVFRISGAGSLNEPLAWLAAGGTQPVRIVEASAEGVADGDLFTTAAWDFQSSLHVYGRRKSAGRFQLKLTLERDGRREPFEWQLEARDDSQDVFVGRLWAQRKLDQLRAQELASPQSTTLRERQVTLSQEWTLLNPHTAFLVLENEADYGKYGIRRALRRKYWQPTESVVALPLKPDELKRLKNSPPMATTLTADRLAQIIADSRQALDARLPDRAVKLLKEVEGSPLAQSTPQFAAVRDAALKMLARADLFEKLGPHRGWFDRSRPIGFPTMTHDLVWQLVYGIGAAPTETGPLAVLLKPVPPPDGELSLEEFIDWVKATSGLNLLIDKTKLMEEGVALDQPIPRSFRGLKTMTLQNMLRHALDPIQLACEVDGEVLTVTTSFRAAERLETRLYPFGDLVLTTQAVPYSLLANGELDRALHVKHRFEQKLDRKISVNFNERPLEDVFDFLAEQIDDNLLIDRTRLIEEGVALDQPISLELRDVSLRQILKSVLEPVQLAHLIYDEAILITTSQVCGEKLQAKVHAAQDIVYEIPPELYKQLRAHRPLRKTFALQGGLGGMGGGAMGAGGMGGMGPSMMGGSSGALPDSAVGLSESGESSDWPAPADDGPNRAKKAIPNDGAGAGPAASVAAAPVETRSAAPDRVPGRPTNAEEMLDLIQATIQPDSWQPLSGPGSLLYYPGALGFVVLQTQAVHDELAAFLDRLRALPPAFSQQSGLAPARVPLVGANDIENWEPEAIVDLLKTVVQPDSWEDLSGPGSVAMHTTKLTLAIHQTQSVHEEIRGLLTSLRRARYLARRGRIWKTFDMSSGPWFPIALGVTDLPPTTAESAAPVPDAAERKSLEILAEPLAGEQVWRSTSDSGRPNEKTVVRVSAGRLEFELDGRITRVAGDEAAVAYPGLSLVERGPWGTALRRIVDGRLPWLPHRSRRELAQLFTVQTVAQNPQTVQLRLALREGSAGDEITVTVDRKTGLPTVWESRMAGQSVLRLRFSELRQAKGKPLWSRIIAEDAAGRQIERWDLVSYAELKGEIPTLDQEWQNAVLLDLRDQELSEIPPFIEALQALRSLDGKAVDSALAGVLSRNPRQPLVSFLKAWSLAQSPRHEAEIVSLLTDVARSAAGDLIRNISDGAFLHVSAREMYAVLLEVPERQRTPADYDHLSRMAERAGQPEAAIRHLRSAIEKEKPASDTPDRTRRLVQMLLAANQPAAAVELARTRSNREDIAAEQIPALADILARGGEKQPAHQLIVAALSRPQATGITREELLMGRAEFEVALIRWRTLIEAASLLPEKSNQRLPIVARVVREMAQAEEFDLAGQLAHETKDQEIAAGLWLAQAENEVQRANAAAAADICWNLYEARQLPSDRYGWFLSHLHTASQHERVIWFVEDRLRAGEAVDFEAMHSIVPLAYEALGRTDDANRARTQPRPPAPQPAGRFQRGGMGGGFF